MKTERLLIIVIMFFTNIIAFPNTCRASNRVHERDTITIPFNEPAYRLSGTLDFNEFLSEAHVELKFKVTPDGKAYKIRVTEIESIAVTEIEKKDLKVIENILKESSISFVEQNNWNTESRRCTIKWVRDSVNHSQSNHEFEKFIQNPNIEFKLMKELRANSSAYICVHITADGTVSKVKYLGSIVWEIKNRPETSTDFLDIDINSIGNIYNSYDRSRSTTITAVRRAPSIQEIEHGKNVKKVHKLMKANARHIGDIIKEYPHNIGTLHTSGVAKRIVIEINIDATNIETVETSPVYPGGSEALMELMKRKLHESGIIEKNDIKGNIVIELYIKENGKANITNVISRIRKKDGNNCDKKIKEKVEKMILRAGNDMQPWKPGTKDGTPVDYSCSLRIQL